MQPLIQHRPFGNTGLNLPSIVFGATVLGNLFVAPSDETKRELIRQWFDCMPGPIVIDSAGKYGAGLSLEVIGRELAAFGINHRDVVISNKLAWRSVPLVTAEPTFEPGVWIDLKRDAIQDISYEGILRCYEDGSDKLGDYAPQLVSVHDPDEYLAAATDSNDRHARLQDLIGAYQALFELKADGKVAGVGVGAKNWRAIQELDQHCELDWVMMANSYTVMHHPVALQDFVASLASRNIAIINSAVTHGGFLTGGRFLDYREIDANNPDDARHLQWRESFTAICHQHQVSPYAVSVAFGAAHPAFNAVALTTSSPDRVIQMVQAATQTLPSEIWQALKDRGLIEVDYLFVN